MTTLDEQLAISKQKLSQDLRSLSPSTVIELFEVDLSTAGYTGTTIQRLHNGVTIKNTDIIWAGNTYSRFPIKCTGFEFTGKGQLPRPTLSVSNITGAMGAIIRDYNDLLGVKVTRIRTLLKYIDHANFPGKTGYPNGFNPYGVPDILAKLPDDIYYIDRKSKEDKFMIEFELAASFDVSTVQLPRRQIVQNMCSWKYKGTECGYSGSNYYDIKDVTCAPEVDVCGKRLTSCQLRWGTNTEIPFGGFPSVGLIK